MIPDVSKKLSLLEAKPTRSRQEKIPVLRNHQPSEIFYAALDAVQAMKPKNKQIH